MISGKTAMESGNYRWIWDIAQYKVSSTDFDRAHQGESSICCMALWSLETKEAKVDQGSGRPFTEECTADGTKIWWETVKTEQTYI